MEHRQLIKKIYAYKLANSKIKRGQNLIEFVKNFFDGHIPTFEEWNYFFIDLMKEYSINEKKPPKIEILDVNDCSAFKNLANNASSVIAGYEWSERRIIFSKDVLQKVSLKNYSFMKAVLGLMHEYRHFYQYEAQKEFGGRDIDNIFGDNFEYISRGLKMPLISTINQVEEICKYVRIATKKCEFINGLSLLEPEKQHKILNYISYCCYYNAPHEKDARKASENMLDVVFGEWYDFSDEKLQGQLEKDYKNFINNPINKNLKIAEKYYYCFIKELKNLSLEEIEIIALEIEKLQDAEKSRLLLGMINLIFGMLTAEKQLAVIKEAMNKNCVILTGKFIKVFDFNKKERREIEKFILENFALNKIDYRIVNIIALNHDFLSLDSLKKLITSSVKSEYFKCAEILFSIFSYRDFGNYENDFVEKLTKILVNKANFLLSEPVSKERNEKLKEINGLLERIDEEFILDDESFNLYNQIDELLENSSEKE